MATRAFAKMTTDFHDEPSIRNLTIDQQWAYELILKRPDLSRCGVVAYTPRRWAKFAHDATEKKLRKLYDQLVQTRHIVLDDDTEEVLARTYVRHDGLLTQPNVVASMVSDYRLISSPTIRTAFLAELRRIWDLDLEHNARGGWLLAMGHYPAVVNDGSAKFPDGMTAKSIAFLQKAIGPGLEREMREAIGQGSVRPFDEGSEKGSPQGFGEPPRVRAGGAPAPTTTTAPTTAPSAASGTVVAPARDTAPAPADPTNPALTRPTDTLNLLDKTGPYVPKIRAALAGEVDQLLAAGTDIGAVERALGVWRTRKAGPGLLAHLVQDELTPDQLQDPRFAGLIADAQASRRTG